MSSSTFYRRAAFHPKTEQTTRPHRMNAKAKCAVCKSYFPRDETFFQNQMTRICSSECLSDYMDRKRPKQTSRPASSSKPAGRMAPKIPIEVRAEVHTRDGNSCRMCGHRGNQCHHVQYRSQGGLDIASNLILLCNECHQTKAHGPEARQYRELFRAYIWLVNVENQALSIPEIQRIYGHLVESVSRTA